MRVMVLTDASFAHREHQLLTRLEIGLADDGATILHAVPARCSAETVNAFSSTIVRYDDSHSPLWRAARARQLLAATGEVFDTTDTHIDLLHVFGRGAWALAEAVALESGAALVLEVWRADFVEDAVMHARRHVARAAAGAGLLTSSERIGEELGGAVRRIGAQPRIASGVAPWGVASSDFVRIPIDPSRAFAISVLAEARGGRGVAELKCLLEGLQRAARRYENLLVFLDGAAADRPSVWRAARRLKLLDRITAVAEMEARREPILQTDILALPEPDAACRTLPLAAMADGVAVIARPDAAHSSWLNEKTSRLVGALSNDRPATPEEWERAIVAAVENEAETASLRNTARVLVQEDRTLTAYVDAVRGHYQAVLQAAPVTVGATG